VNRKAGTEHHSVTKTRPKAESRFSLCPQCGRKGVYRVQGKFYLCRYCGLYRMMTPGSVSKGERIFLAIVAKQDKRRWKS